MQQATKWNEKALVPKSNLDEVDYLEHELKDHSRVYVASRGGNKVSEARLSSHKW
jgi:hypothetical protein